MIIRGDLLSRSSGHACLEDTIGEACAVCAEAISTCIVECARGNAYMHILETVYFSVIFIIQSVHELFKHEKTAVNTLIYMILSTLVSWIDSLVFRCINVLYDRQRYDIDKLRAKLLFRSLVDLYVSVIDSALFQ